MREPRKDMLGRDMEWREGGTVLEVGWRVREGGNLVGRGKVEDKEGKWGDGRK